MSPKILAKNKKARFLYFIFDKYEAGIELKGAEVKSARAGKLNISDSYVRVKDGEVFAVNMHISENQYSSVFKLDPKRTRKLLLNKNEISRISGKSNQKGFSAVPLSVYIKGKYIKIEIALVKGKKQFDKKQTIKEKDIAREMDREIKDRR